ERGDADPRHRRHVRLEADLEEQEDDADLAEEGEVVVADREVEDVPADEIEVADHDAGRALAEHGRHADALEQIAAQLGGAEHDRERDEEVGVHGASSHHMRPPAATLMPTCISQGTSPVTAILPAKNACAGCSAPE